MTKKEFIKKWRGIYAKKNKHVQVLSKRLCEDIDPYTKQAMIHCQERVEAEAQTINIMLLELENEVE